MAHGENISLRACDWCCRPVPIMRRAFEAPRTATRFGGPRLLHACAVLALVAGGLLAVPTAASAEECTVNCAPAPTETATPTPTVTPSDRTPTPDPTQSLTPTP